VAVVAVWVLRKVQRACATVDGRAGVEGFGTIVVLLPAPWPSGEVVGNGVDDGLGAVGGQADVVRVELGLLQIAGSACVIHVPAACSVRPRTSDLGAEVRSPLRDAS
jgi:hypothetical protein